MKNNKKLTHDELVHLLQAGKINFLQFVAGSEYGPQYIDWCKEMNIEINVESAELFYEQMEIDMLEHQYINEEYDGYWL